MTDLHLVDWPSYLCILAVSDGLRRVRRLSCEFFPQWRHHVTGRDAGTSRAISVNTKQSGRDECEKSERINLTSSLARCNDFHPQPSLWSLKWSPPTGHTDVYLLPTASAVSLIYYHYYYLIFSSVAVFNSSVSIILAACFWTARDQTHRHVENRTVLSGVWMSLI